MLTRLQILRGFAAYMVVLLHWGDVVRAETDYFVPMNNLGNFGVDLFFVVSGIVMVYVAGRKASPGRFIFERIARIVPLYWIATLAIVAAQAFRPWLFAKSLVTPETILSSLFFIPADNAVGSLEPILFVGWTLNLEMVFYALFALSMFGPKAWRVPLVLGLITIVYAIGVMFSADHVISFYGNPILFEFAAGCVLGSLVTEPTRFPALSRLSGWAYIAAGLALLVANEFFLPSFDNRFIRWGIPASLIVTGVIVLDLKQPIKPAGLLVSLGDSSYSAYLLHWFVLAACSLLIMPLMGGSLIGVILTYPVVIGITALLSTFSYRLIEIPARDFLRRRFPPKRTKAIAETG